MQALSAMEEGSICSVSPSRRASLSDLLSARRMHISSHLCNLSSKRAERLARSDWTREESARAGVLVLRRIRARASERGRVMQQIIPASRLL